MGFLCVCFSSDCTNIFLLVTMYVCKCVCDEISSYQTIYGSLPIGASTPACVIRSPMLFSKSSIRFDMSSMREITWSDIDWNLSCTFCSNVCTYIINNFNDYSICTI